MFDKDAIQELTKAQAITAAREAINGHGATGAVALPAEFSVQDLERFMPNRRRLRGTMTTSVIGDFAAYVKENAEPGARVFVNTKTISAEAVLNIGTPQAPGHADNRAALRMQSTAAYAALVAIANGSPLKQSAVAEFLEDWQTVVTCYREGEFIPVSQAIAAVRAITIDAMKKLVSEEQQLSASRSTFEQIKAGSDLPFPTLIEFRADPYLGLAERVFGMRLSIHTGGDKPAVALRIINSEKHAEEMAAELAGLVREAIGGDVPVILGGYEVKA